MELPVRKILLVTGVETSVNPRAMHNPQALDFFVQFAKQLSSNSHANQKSQDLQMREPLCWQGDGEGRSLSWH